MTILTLAFLRAILKLFLAQGVVPRQHPTYGMLPYLLAPTPYWRLLEHSRIPNHNLLNAHGFTLVIQSLHGWDTISTPMALMTVG